VTELDPASQLEGHAQRAKMARESLVGKTIAGRYVLRGVVGHGGMGAVYEAEHLGLGKRVAIKFVDPEFATDEQVVARFAREARAMSAIESAHIVTVFDAGSEDGRPYLVMELLRGEDLGERLRRMRRVPLGEAMHVVAQVLKGLARAHAAGIVHRDLKPDNVFLVKHDTDPLFAKIVDFGISKIERPRANTHPLALTGRGTVLGTPFYMSPEQAQAAADVDGRTDLYSAGAILFECLTGRPPHTGESYEQVILSICMRDAPELQSIEPSVPADVSAFVARALTRDRTKRFASAEHMLAALHEVAPAERARVPLDPVSPETLKSAGVEMAATMLDGGSPVRSSRPSFDEIGAATRLGVGSLDGSGTPSPSKAEPSASDAPAEPPAAAAMMKAEIASEPQPASTKASPADGADAKRLGSPRPRAPSDSSSPGKPAQRPIGVALVTATVATLAGVGATFFVISMLARKPEDATAPLTTSLSAHAPAPDAATATSIPTGTASATSSATAAPPADAAPAPPSTASPKPGTPSSARPRTVAPSKPPPPPPGPSSTKPLDIQRDLP
jgi:eukaryotic-like serine/threonine-protein kinase